MYNRETVFILLGVNLPDHEALFATLSSQLHDRVTPYIATLQARHCTTVRSAIEHMVLQFMNYDKVHTVSFVVCHINMESGQFFPDFLTEKSLLMFRIKVTLYKYTEYESFSYKIIEYKEQN
jgi:hypothetical protein